MPYIEVKIEPAPTANQATVLADGITKAMVELMGKRQEVTAVRIATGDTALWTIGGTPCAKPTAHLRAEITVGTNSSAEKAEFLKRMHILLVETLGELAEASYIVIHEIPAENWGYGGKTQAARAGRA
ncbi:MAG: tautomerase family protein [Chromatiales bacterium]|nr:tautomerase family protein [Chromatiales bacterium]